MSCDDEDLNKSNDTLVTMESPALHRGRGCCRGCENVEFSQVACTFISHHGNGRCSLTHFPSLLLLLLLQVSFYEALKGRTNLANLGKGMFFFFISAQPDHHARVFSSSFWVYEGARNRYEGLTSQLTVRIKLNK